jgi:hypothetical protein
MYNYNGAEHCFTVETPFGAVTVTASSKSHVYVSCDRDRPLTVNRVEWRVSFHMNDYGSGWVLAEDKGRRQQWDLDRADFRVKSNWDSEQKAKVKIEATIPQLVVAALATKRELLRNAEVARLRGRYAAVSADVRQLEKQLIEKKKELDSISVESIAALTEDRKELTVYAIARSTESQLLTT